jgi:DNA polymerase-3 subunit delta
MSGLPTIPPVRADRVLSAYFFSGEDLFSARRFVRDLRQALTTPDGETVQVETFNLDVHGWREILDVAKSLPFFFAPRRILVVEGKGAGLEGLSAGEAAAFRDYFAAPTDRTTIVVLFEGKIHKTKPLGKALYELPDTVALAVELHPLKDKDLKPWIEDRFEALGKRATPEAIERLLDIAGSDLGRLEAEVEKIVTFIGPKKSVEGDDVSALSTVKNFENWELKDALEKGATDKALVILKSLFDDGQAPELIFSGLIGFFRDLLLARSGLREGRDPKVRKFLPDETEGVFRLGRADFGRGPAPSIGRVGAYRPPDQNHGHLAPGHDPGIYRRFRTAGGGPSDYFVGAGVISATCLLKRDLYREPVFLWMVPFFTVWSTDL